jgi:hypothetical protein
MAITTFDHVRELYLSAHDLARTPEERLACVVAGLERLGRELKERTGVEEPGTRLASATELAAKKEACARCDHARESGRFAGLIQGNILIRRDPGRDRWEVSMDGPPGYDRVVEEGDSATEALCRLSAHLELPEWSAVSRCGCGPHGKVARAGPWTRGMGRREVHLKPIP